MLPARVSKRVVTKSDRLFDGGVVAIFSRGTGVSADEGREALFEEVTRKHQGLISRIALSYEADPALRRELTQDILLAVWIALESFRGDSALRTFVASIAQKRSISHVTRRVREPRQVELAEDIASGTKTPDEIAMENDRKKTLVQSIQRLPLPQREAIALCLKGFSYGEVGQILGISANAATLRCRRARAALVAGAGPGSVFAGKDFSSPI